MGVQTLYICNSCSAGMDFSRHNPMFKVVPRTERVKNNMIILWWCRKCLWLIDYYPSKYYWILQYNFYASMWIDIQRKIFKLNFQSLENVSRYRETQLQATENMLFVKFKSQCTWDISVFQVTENLCYLWKFSPNIYQYFKIEGIFYCEQLIIRDYAGTNENTECLLQLTSVV